MSYDINDPVLKQMHGCNTQIEVAPEMTLGVTKEKLEAMKAYALKLRKKFPHMTPSRVQRKVCEYFKVKLT